jgi:hypothetical protein
MTGFKPIALRLSNDRAAVCSSFQFDENGPIAFASDAVITLNLCCARLSLKVPGES